VLDHLVKKLNEFGFAENKDEVVREIHLYYDTFLRQLTLRQQELDKKPSPNAPELNLLFNSKLGGPLENLTMVLTRFVTERENRGDNLEACQKAILGVRRAVVQAHKKLNEIERNEKGHLERLHMGTAGVILTSIEKIFAATKEAVKGPAKTLVGMEVSKMTAKARKLMNNPLFVETALLWQMRNFQDPRA